MDDHIEIDLNEQGEKEEKLKKRSDGTETLIDIEKGIFVNLGIPSNENGAVLVPEKPHIFMADELHVKDKSHPEGIVLKNTPVLMAHGVRDQNDKWKFTEGQSVTDTIEAYNKYAKKELLPAVEFVAACNEDPVAQNTGVRVAEFNQNSVIAHAVGEVMHVQGVVEDNGLTRVYIQTQDNIMNLDELMTYKEINIR